MNTHARSIAALAGLALATAANATIINVYQEFREDRFDITGRNLFIFARVDTSGLSGVGVERVLIDVGTLEERQNGIGQNFYYMAQPDPPSFNSEGSVFAEFVDGVFDDVLGTVNLGGNGFTALARNAPDGPITAVAAFGRNEIIYGTTLFNNRFLLHSSRFEVVPAPGAVAMVSACGLLATRRRRA